MDPVSFATVFALGTDVKPSPQSPPPAVVSPAEVAEKIAPAIKLVPAPTKAEPIPAPAPAPQASAPAPAPAKFAPVAPAAPAPVQRPVVYRSAPQPQYYPQQYNWFYPNTYSAGGCANGRCGR